ncbi:hypothetical protein cypCar_00032992 [Cyprinus carpio]|nr:hypothetical protein cypCar_00032992 [Cyprinus carpio]
MMQERFFLFFSILFVAHTAYGDVSYSVPEEMKRGSVIGNIAKDLGLDVNRLSSRKARIDTEVQSNSLGEKYAEIILNKELDREQQKDLTLILTAVDGGTPPRSDIYTYYIAGEMFGFLFFVLMAHTAYGDVSYSVPEEMKHGSVIGNIAKDLGLDVNRLSSRKARVDAEGNRKRYCDINLNTGELIVAERIDREGLCGKKASCVLNQEFVMENPLELYSISLRVQDVNDNSPNFGKDEIHLEIRESADKGKRFLLEANDADIGQNSVQSYAIQNNGYFLLSVQSNSLGEKYAELILNKEFDRESEQQSAPVSSFTP